MKPELIEHYHGFTKLCRRDTILSHPGNINHSMWYPMWYHKWMILMGLFETYEIIKDRNETN